MEQYNQETIKSHFSHPHPLKLIVYKQTLNLTSPCSACKIEPSGMIYCCIMCEDHFLHQRCFEMPKKMTHPCHEKHGLTLISKPANRNEHYFVCDACSERGKGGFSYHCKPCRIDLHLLCAVMPLSVTHDSHVHKLHLTFESYPEKKFSCNICMNTGSRQWVYKCKPCGFDAHLKCATGDAPSVHRPPSQMKEPPPQQAATCYTLDPSAPQLPPPMQQRQNIMPPADPPFEVNISQNHELAIHAVEQMIISNSNSLAQAILSGGRFFGSYGDNTGLHLLIKWISAINISPGISGGGNYAFDGFASTGGGGGQNSLHMVKNGGGEGLVEGINDGGGGGGRGGGQDYLKAVMGGGGGSGGGGGGCQDSLHVVKNGADFVQGINDGGGSSGGGQDYLKAVVHAGGVGGGSLPEKITHPFDKKHELTLQTKPAYDEGRFICDACGEKGQGYSYNCQPCGIDLHISCTMMPFFVTRDSHVHTLRLVFESPYPNKKFCCGICLGPGYHHWLYRCNSCGFDAHLKCAAGDVPPVHLRPTSQPQDASAWGRPPPLMMNMSFPEGQVPINVPSFEVDNSANAAMAQGLMRFISNGANISGGGSGGGGEEDYQELLFGDGNGIGFLGGLLGG